MAFGLGDYFRMWRARGVRLPVCYFRENHLFDLRHRTETHARLLKDDYADRPEDLAHGVLYMSSWTSTVRQATRQVLEDAGVSPARFAFVDVGCGKGKVLCVWSRMFRAFPPPLLVGVDYSRRLLEKCRRNLETIGAAHFRLIEGGADGIDYRQFGDRFLFYLYNPFDAVVLRRFLDGIDGLSCYVVYSHPVHAGVFDDAGFVPVARRDGWHPNATYAVFSNRPKR